MRNARENLEIVIDLEGRDPVGCSVREEQDIRDGKVTDEIRR